MTPREPHLFGSLWATTHSGPWDYLQDVPLVFYGPGFFASNGPTRVEREVTLADVAPTLAQLLDMPFPDDRVGRPVTEALVPDADRPRVIVVVVWDGGGWNVLDESPRAWPFLKSLMQRGTSVADAVVGSSPSVTPAVHSTIGTGAFPDQHGVVDIWVRRGDRTRDAFGDDLDPTDLRIDTVAELYDRSVGNDAKVAAIAKEGWHLGMIGHGAANDGGGKDIGVVEDLETGELMTNPDFYTLPHYVHDVPGLEDDIRTVDLADGVADGRWRDAYELSANDLSNMSRTPVRVLYQTRVVQEVMEREGFGQDDVTDLMFTNYKPIDDVGHQFNMASEEQADVIEFADAALKSLVRSLDNEVGKRKWAMVVTADHGQGPAPALTGGWGIDVDRVKQHVQEAADVNPLFASSRPTGYWLHPDVEDKAAIAQVIANALADYTVRDDASGDEVPDSFEGELDDRLFESAFPMAEIGSVIRCARKRS